MLDLPRMQRVTLTARPMVQRIVAMGLLTPNYYLPPRVRIAFEGQERVPEEPVIFAMNHTDRYNYWPFQYTLWRRHARFTATWVKGKYYEHPMLATFMELTNNIPTVSRGYIITRDFLASMGRRPADHEYAALRAWVDDSSTTDTPLAPPDDVPDAILSRPRGVLGRRFDPSHESYASCVNSLFAEFMKRFVELHYEAFAKGLDLIVFPQGTRSVRLSRGRIGLAEVALRFKKTVVPVGCNGCDRVYPGGSPWAKGGRIVYRFGEPIRYEDMAEFHIAVPFEPFDARVEARHRDTFQGYVDVVMDRINELLDPRHQFGEDLSGTGVKGTDRFV